MDRVEKMTTEPVIGERYLVPCIYHEGISKYLPVIGPPHEDPKYFPGVKEHFHFDLRFLSESLIDFYLDGFHDTERTKSIARERKAMIVVIHARNRKVANVEMECLRRMPIFPIEGVLRNFQLIEFDFTYYVIPNREAQCFRCPHRGTPLNGLPVDENGNVTCPAHGLRWNVESGQNVRRLP